MTTINNIYDVFSSISSRHRQINSFGFGQVTELATSGTINFPIMYVVPNGATANVGEVGYKFTIIVADIVEKGKQNEVDVLSDAFQIATDIIADLKIGGQSFNAAYGFDVRPKEVALTDFMDKFDEEIGGWQFDISLWADWDWNQCRVPFSSTSPNFNLTNNDGTPLEINY